MIKEIPSDFTVNVTEEPPQFQLNETEKQLVEEIWRGEHRETKVEGLFLHLINIHERSVTGSFVPYKYYLAQEKVPTIRDKLQLCPVALSGVTLAGDSLLLGQRSHTVTQFPLYWEFAPSGGIDDRFVEKNRVDYRRQIMQELEEETGIDRQYINEVAPKWLYLDRDAPIVDICLEIHINKEGKNPFKKPTAEYLALEWVDRAKLTEFFHLHQDQFVPTTIDLISKIIK